MHDTLLKVLVLQKYYMFTAVLKFLNQKLIICRTVHKAGEVQNENAKSILISLI